MMAAVITADSNGIVISDFPVDLRWLQTAVEGKIEAITIGDCTMFCNEEGKLSGLPVNGIATELVAAAFGGVYDVIVGDVVLLGGPDGNGDSTDLTMTGFDRLTKAVTRHKATWS